MIQMEPGHNSGWVDLVKIAAPGKYWLVEKDGFPVQKRVTTADDPSTITHSIPESCDVAEVDSREALRDVEIDVEILTDGEKNILGIL